MHRFRLNKYIYCRYIQKIFKVSSKKKKEKKMFLFFSKDIYLFMNIYLAPFRVISPNTFRISIGLIAPNANLWIGKKFWHSQGVCLVVRFSTWWPLGGVRSLRVSRCVLIVCRIYFNLVSVSKTNSRDFDR